MALTGRIWVGLAFAACVAATPAAAAARPGSIEMRIGGFGRDRILSVDTAGSDRIVIAGITNGYPHHHSWVRAYLPDGRPDSTLGGDGILEFDDTKAPYGGIGAQVLDDGRILVVQAGGDYYTLEPLVIRRLNPDGSPDQTFGTGGSIQSDFEGPYGTFLTDVIPDHAGRMIVVGANAGGSGSPTRFVVRRYLADGSRDTAFGTNGETIMEGDHKSSATGTLTPDGGVLLTFLVEGYPTLVHLSEDGTLDRSFAGGGSAPMPLAEPGWRAGVRRLWRGVRAVVLPDGRIRLPVAFDMPHERDDRMALVGLTPDGRPDLGFGFRGLALGPRPLLPGEEPGGEEPGPAIADATGSVIVAGSVRYGEEFNTQHLGGIIRRFRPDGSLDRSFGQRGLVPAALAGDPIQSLALLGPDVLVAGEYTYDGKYQFWGSTALRTLNAGHDRDRPTLRVNVRTCRAALVEIADESEIEAVARIGGRVVRRTTRKRFRVESGRGGRRVSVRATDLAENVARKRVRLPRC